MDDDEGAPRFELNFSEQVTDQRNIIRQRIREVRTQKGMSQGQVAKAIGCSRPFFNQVEGGKRVLSLVKLIQIAHVLGVSLATLTRPRTIVEPDPTELTAEFGDVDDVQGEAEADLHAIESGHKTRGTRPRVQVINHASWTYHTNSA
jgi:transcriptional regulator with XRE-family HTH domain